MYAIEAVLGQYTIAIGTRLRDRSDDTSVRILPYIRIVERIRLTQIQGIRLEEGRVNGQVQMFDRVTTVDRLTGPFIRTREGQIAAVEIVRLFVRYMLLDDLIYRRMNREDIFRDRVATYQRRYSVVEESALEVLLTVEEEGISGAERNILLHVERVVNGQVERLHYARRVGPSDRQTIVAALVVLVATPDER